MMLISRMSLWLINTATQCVVVHMAFNCVKRTGGITIFPPRLIKHAVCFGETHVFVFYVYMICLRSTPVCAKFILSNEHVHHAQKP